MRFIFTFLIINGLYFNDAYAQDNLTAMDTATIVFVKKPFVKKNGTTTDQYEWYARLSIQDYFIKFCASDVSQKVFEHRMRSLDNDLIKSIKVSYEIKDGNWDQCDENEVQSRVGPYMILHKLFDQ